MPRGLCANRPGGRGESIIKPQVNFSPDGKTSARRVVPYPFDGSSMRVIIIRSLARNKEKVFLLLGLAYTPSTCKYYGLSSSCSFLKPTI